MASTKPPVTDVWGQSNTTSPDMATPSYIDTGFPAPSGIPVKPPRGYVNWLHNQHMNATRYFSRVGIVEWDSAETDYVAGAVVRSTDGKVYALFGTATTGTSPQSDRGNWMPVLNPVHRPISAWDTNETQYAIGDLVIGSDGATYQCIDTPTAGQTPVGSVRWMCLEDKFGIRAKSRLQEFEEDWCDIDSAQKITLADGPWFGRWKFGNFGSGGAWAINADGPNLNSNFPRGALVSLSNNGTTVAAASVVEAATAPFRFMTSIATYEVDLSVTGSADPQSGSSFAFGLGDGTLISGALAGAFADAFTIFGLGFAKRAASSTWVAWVRKPGTSYVEASTGVSFVRNVPHRFRIEIVGSNHSTGPRITWYIDDVQVADLSGTSYDMTGNGGMAVFPFFRMSGVNGEVTTMNAGRLRVAARLF